MSEGFSDSGSVSSQSSRRTGGGSPTKKRVGADFQPDPPLEEQVRKLTNAVTELTQFAENSYMKDDTDGKDAQKRSRKRPNFQGMADKLTDGYHKLFCDIWRSLRAAQRRSDANTLQSIKSLLANQVQQLSQNMASLRDSHNSVIKQAFKQGTFLESLITPLNELLNKLSINNLQDFKEMSDKAYEMKDNRLSTSIYSSLCNEIYNYVQALNDAHQTLIDSVRDYTNDHQEEEEEEEIDNRSSKSNSGKHPKINGFDAAIKEVSDSVRNSYKNLSSLVLALYQESITKQREEPAAVTEDDEELEEQEPIFSPSKIYGIRIELFQQLCDEYNSSKNGTKYEDSSESDSEEQEEEYPNSDPRYIEFLQNEIAVTVESLTSELYQLWDVSHKLRVDPSEDPIGLLIYQLVEDRVSAIDPSLMITDISTPYNIAVKENNDFTADSFKNLLLNQIEQEINDLENMRRQQLKLLSQTPSPEKVKEFCDSTKKLTEDVENKAISLNMALRHGREADFIISRRPKSSPLDAENENEYDDDESPKKKGNAPKEEEIIEQDEFQAYDKEESDNIHTHLSELQKLIDKVYQSIDNDRKTNIRRPVSDTASVSSSASKKSTKRISKAEMSRLNPEATPEQSKQILCIETAISSIYIQLFASIKGMMTSTIRIGEYRIAEQMNEKLHSNVQDYLNHLQDLKKRALADLDLQTAQETETQIAQIQINNNDDLLKCITESLKDIVEMCISNYERNVDDIDDKYQEEEEKERKNLDKRFGDIEMKVHIPALVLLEKQLKVAIVREQMRTSTQITEKETEIRTLAQSGNYKEAEKEKQKLELAREKDIQERVKAVEEKYGKQRTTLLQQQQRDLMLFEDSFNTKMEQLHQKQQAEKDDQLNTLSSSIRSSHQRHVQFGIRIMNLNSTAKKDLSNKLMVTVKKVIEEQKYKDLIRLDEK